MEPPAVEPSSPDGGAAPETSQPDIMNDPAFDPSGKGKERNNEDPDTCRICRGEGSPTEPLFYPCRCSGSIKFVHQECLMGWLSHSQKKHCELCKTPFRFTKLYHPQMPSTVPVLVFLKRAGLHCLGSLLTVVRWIMVLGVWLGWVPWCMRIVWRGLFWIGDGGWITVHEIERRIAMHVQEHAAMPGTSPASSGLPSPTSPASNALSIALGNIRWNPFNVSFKPQTEQPIILRVVRSLYRMALFPAPKRVDHGNVTLPAQLSLRPGSLLSDYPFVSNLTRSPTINNLATDMLEGQLIALLVVVGFILVFLIREWVVQQQPAINAGQAPEEVANDDNQAEEAHEAEIEDIPQHVFEPEHDNFDDLTLEGHPEATADAPQPAERLGTPPIEIITEPHQLLHPEGDQNRASATGVTPDQHVPVAGSSRPPLPHRGALTPASEIQRTLEEEAMVAGHPWPGVGVFMDLWRRAQSDPAEVQRIIREDGKEEELAWIMSAMDRLKQGLPITEAEAERLDLRAYPGVTGQSSAHSSWLVVEDENSSGEPSANPESRSTLPSTTQEPLNEQAQTIDFTALHDARLERQINHVASPSLPPEAQENEDTSRTVGTLDVDQTAETEDHIADAPVGVNAFAPLQPEVPLQDVATNAQAAADASETGGPTENRPGPEEDDPRDRNWAQAVQHWLWGDIPDVPEPAEDFGEDDEHIVQDVENEAPFVPVAGGQLLIDDGEDEEEPEGEFDPEVLQAAAEAGINPNEADIDDAEDIEGVLELIGAQGPLIGLFQNGMFCAVLIAMAFFAGVWIPYITGKFVLVFLANPIPLLFKLPLRWTSNLADMIVDVLVFFSGWAFYVVDALVKLTATPVGWIFPFVKHISQDNVLGAIASRHAAKSGNRLAKTFVASGDIFSESDIPVFSIIAHESLVDAQHILSAAVTIACDGILALSQGLTSDTTVVEKAISLSHALVVASSGAGRLLTATLAKITPGVLWSLRSFPFSISIDTPQRSYPLDYSLAYWSTQDRVIAVLIGYGFIFFVGATYLKISAALRDPGQRPGDFVDALNQAGGVTKVILIISIEMIVFPLYCGALLDIALLPLFDQATIASRVSFTAEAPMTSTFIHWFIGTCYMFHFALFVSMCRKLMRTGVLYFIRDPDDPSFHPVRDVLEKNVYTQLRKIAFSAVVYGALVLVCLGTVVWTVSKTTSGIFPIRWSSSRPVLEYPIDLLVYNLVMPIAMTFFKPGTTLTAVYNWWFRKCARWLRLTHFLFGEKREEEMYRFERDPFRNLRLSDSTRPDNYLAEERRLLQSQEIASFYPTGNFVRAPASDQVRLPKGSKTFVPVDEHGNRTDGVADSDQGAHGRHNRMFKKIFIPNRFKLRISAFITLLWLFAAATGMLCTVGPLLFGRVLFAQLLPPDLVVNDVYAFALGAYLLGGPVYLGVRFRAPISSVLRRVAALPQRAPLSLVSLRPVAAQAVRVSLRAARLTYFYAGLGLLFPLLLGLLWETYVIIPMITVLHPLAAPPYTIRFVQSWTLAVIALKYAVRVALQRRDSRAARALRALVGAENRGAGWTDPDVRLATRAFVLPALVLVGAALAVPFAGAALALQAAGVRDEERRAVVFRYAYPWVLWAGLNVLAVRSVGRGLRAWREKVRDEVFLVGERLHNFGERRTSPGVPQNQGGARPGHEVQRVDVRA